MSPFNSLFHTFLTSYIGIGTYLGIFTISGLKRCPGNTRKEKTKSSARKRAIRPFERPLHAFARPRAPPRYFWGPSRRPTSRLQQLVHLVIKRAAAPRLRAAARNLCSAIKYPFQLTDQYWVLREAFLGDFLTIQAAGKP